MHGHEPAPLAIRSVAALVICLLFGCSDAAGPEQRAPGRANTAKLAPGSACLADEECSLGRCHPERRICICVSDASCPAQLQCDPFSGRCVRETAGCTADADCAAGLWCDTSSRTCRPLRAFCEPCDADPDCGPGNRCLEPEGGGADFCGEACSSSADCSRPRTRCVSGQCRPLVDCEDVAPCRPDSLRPCGADADCPAGDACDRTVRICRAIDSGCAAGESCDSDTRECYVACTHLTEARDCAATEQCEDGRCVALPACAIDDDCPLPRVCRVDSLTGVGTCIPGCSSDDACPLGEQCVTRGGPRGRSVCEPGCNDHADCAIDQICDLVLGQCTAPGAGRCQSSDACGVCERCDTTGRCVPARVPGVPATNYCGECLSDQDCGAGGYCDELFRCAPPCPPEGCPRGFHCGPVAANQPPSVCFPIDDFCDTECIQ